MTKKLTTITHLALLKLYWSPKIRMLEISGTPFEMGYQHGLSYPKEIAELEEERIQLSSDINWTGQELSRQEVLSLGEACLPCHQAYAPDLMEELSGRCRRCGEILVKMSMKSLWSNPYMNSHQGRYLFQY